MQAHGSGVAGNNVNGSGRVLRGGPANDMKVQRSTSLFEPNSKKNLLGLLSQLSNNS